MSPRSAEKTKLGHEKALWAVDRARSVLQRLGYSVAVPNHVCATGADLEFFHPGIMDEQKLLACEVKLAFFDKRAWRVGKITRKKDEYIAIVFPSGYVHLQSMIDHLKLCNGSGIRHLTELGRLVGE